MEKENTINAPQSALMIHNQYIKDMSIEIPLAPEIFKEMTQAPQMHMDISMNNKKLEGENDFEISLVTKMNGNLGEKPLFIIELTYSAIVSVNVAPEYMEPIMMIELPRLLFPFVRSIIANSLSQAGLPPVLISPIDFVAMYQARKAKEAENANQSAPAEETKDKKKKKK